MYGISPYTTFFKLSSASVFDECTKKIAQVAKKTSIIQQIGVGQRDLSGGVLRRQLGLVFFSKISFRKILFSFDFHRVSKFLTCNHKSIAKVPTSDFQSQFSMSKIIYIFLILNNFSLGEHFLLLTFFHNFNF